MRQAQISPLKPSSRSKSPQVRIYNRNFHLRRVHQKQLEQEADQQIIQLAQKPKITPGSYAILVQKLSERIACLLEKYSPDGKVTFESFVETVGDLGEWPQEMDVNKELAVTQLWLLLAGYQPELAHVARENFEALLHILFCPSVLKHSQIASLLAHAFPHTSEQQLRYSERFPQAGRQVFPLQELSRLWIRIKKTHYAEPLPRKAIIHQLPSFQPTISEKSKKAGQKSLQKYMSSHCLDNMAGSKLNQLAGYISKGNQLSYHELLYQRRLEKDSLLKTSREPLSPTPASRKMTVKQMEQVVSNLHVTRPKREDVDHQALQQQEQLKRCTFHPTTTAYRKPNNASVKNYAKEIGRMQKGRQKKQERQEAYDNLGKVKKSSIAPPSFIQREQPKLILEIKVGQRVEQLRLRGDQAPHLAAKKFINKHALQEDMQSLLEEVIAEQLAEL